MQRWRFWVIMRFWRNLCPQSQVNPTTSPFFLTSRSRMIGALHPVSCLCSLQLKASSSRVNGAKSFALKINQVTYVPSENQKLHTITSNMLNIFSHLFHLYVCCTRVQYVPIETYPFWIYYFLRYKHYLEVRFRIVSIPRLNTPSSLATHPRKISHSCVQTTICLPMQAEISPETASNSRLFDRASNNMTEA